METLNLLEKRIDALTKLLGPIPDKDIKGSENLVDSLFSANTLISSAINNHESIKTVVARSDEVEHYLDPNYLEEKQDAKAKEVYVNTVAPELAANFETLDKIKALEHTLGAEYFCNIPNCDEKLRKMNNEMNEFNQKNELMEESLVLAMQRYCEILQGVTDTLNNMNTRLDKLEDRLTKSKKQPDKDIEED